MNNTCWRMGIKRSGLDHYAYTYTVDGDVTIAIVIGSSGSSKNLYKTKWNMSRVFKNLFKINSLWVEQAQSDWGTVLPTSNDYRLIEV